MRKIKKDDTVQVITGRDAGKTGKVLHVDTVNNRVVVEGVSAFAVEADVAYQVASGMDGQCVFAEQVDLHLVVPVGFFVFVLLDFLYEGVPPCGVDNMAGKLPYVSPEFFSIQVVKV